MNKVALKILTDMIRLIYPRYFTQMQDKEALKIFRGVWWEVIGEYDITIARAALIRYLKNDWIGVPPSPGEIRAIIKDIQKGD